jgi:hypothetical protein
MARRRLLMPFHIASPAVLLFSPLVPSALAYFWLPISTSLALLKSAFER